MMHNSTRKQTVAQHGQQVVRCEETKSTLFRPDPAGQGVWVWCRGHHREELQGWDKLGMTRMIAEEFIKN